MHIPRLDINAFNCQKKYGSFKKLTENPILSKNRESFREKSGLPEIRIEDMSEHRSFRPNARRGNGRMWRLLDKIPWWLLIVAAVLMLIAPVRPMPHVVEKLIMLKNGTLTRPLDIFDLFFHLLPTLLLILKMYRMANR
jgi:hypothetical protein